MDRKTIIRRRAWQVEQVEQVEVPVEQQAQMGHHPVAM
jgi:hypothetical protein